MKVLFSTRWAFSEKELFLPSNGAPKLAWPFFLLCKVSCNRRGSRGEVVFRFRSRPISLPPFPTPRWKDFPCTWGRGGETMTTGWGDRRQVWEVSTAQVSYPPDPLHRASNVCRSRCVCIFFSPRMPPGASRHGMGPYDRGSEKGGGGNFFPRFPQTWGKRMPNSPAAD